MLSAPVIIGLQCVVVYDQVKCRNSSSSRQHPSSSLSNLTASTLMRILLYAVDFGPRAVKAITIHHLRRRHEVSGQWTHAYRPTESGKQRTAAGHRTDSTVDHYVGQRREFPTVAVDREFDCSAIVLRVPYYRSLVEFSLGFSEIFATCGTMKPLEYSAMWRLLHACHGINPRKTVFADIS